MNNHTAADARFTLPVPGRRSPHRAVFEIESLEARVMMSAAVVPDNSVPVAPESASLAPSAPTLTSISTFSAAENRTRVFTYSELYYSSDANDADGEPTSFRIESVVSGTLTKNGQPVVPGVTLLGVDESLVWTPVTDATGVTAAFTVVASDGLLTSETPVTVSADVEPRVIHNITPGANSKFTFVDSESHTVTVTLSGKAGTLQASRAVSDGEPGDLLELDGAGTDSKTKITISVAGKSVTTNVGDILINGPLAGLSGTGVNIRGTVSVSDAIKSLTLNDSGYGASILLGGTASAAGSTIKLGAVSGLDIASTGPIKSFQLVIWNGGSLTAPTVGTLKTTGSKSGAPGDFGANVTLTQTDPAVTSLKSLTVTGAFTYGSVHSTGSIGSITVGRMQSAGIYIGLPADFQGLAAIASDFDDQASTATLAKFTVKGLGDAPAFADVVINALHIGALDLKAIVNTGSDFAFGVAADTIQSLKFSEPSINNGKSVTLKMLDTNADLADAKKNPAAVAFPVGAFELTLV